MRVKTGITRRKRHKKVLNRASGYYSANSRSYKIAVEKNDRALAYAYRDRKTKKRKNEVLMDHSHFSCCKEPFSELFKVNAPF